MVLRLDWYKDLGKKGETESNKSSKSRISVFLTYAAGTKS